MVTHTGKKVQKYAECGDSFPRPFILKAHMLTHSGKKPHNCTQSDFASSRAGNLRDHKIVAKSCDVLQQLSFFTKHSVASNAVIK